MNYYQFDIAADESTSEILVAMLAEQPFEGFEETAKGFKAFIPEQAFAPQVAEALEDLKEKFSFQYSRSTILPKNWNEEWEKNFKPILIDNFCAIRAPFHDPISSVEHEIIIEPKMAFGTGHHETTYMVMKAMQSYDFKHTEVLDFGCGTGILAILANKMGATNIDAIDFDPIAYKNTEENAVLNKANTIVSLLGGKEVIPNKKYGIILANINRNVILDSLTILFSSLKKDGILVTSGFLKQDLALLEQNALQVGFKTKLIHTKGRWVCVEFVKEGSEKRGKRSKGQEPFYCFLTRNCFVLFIFTHWLKAAKPPSL